jgi:hypothetical protein
MPFQTTDRANALDRYDPSSGDNTHSWGFVKYTAKKGTPIENRNPVRPIPLPATGTLPDDEIKKDAIKFVSRGQIVGQCAKGAKKGERIDIILQTPFVATVNMSAIELEL